MSAANFKGRREKLPIMVRVLLRLCPAFHVVILQRTAKKYTKIQNARAEPLFQFIKFLFGDALVAVAVVVC